MMGANNYSCFHAGAWGQEILDQLDVLEIDVQKDLGELRSML